jgi:hypothetical protein
MTIHSNPRPATHGLRDAAGTLPAGGEARPIASLTGRADYPCAICTMSPCQCSRGTMGGDWIGEQVRRADGFDPADYARQCETPARFADLRSGGIIGAVLDRADSENVLGALSLFCRSVVIGGIAGFALYHAGNAWGWW